MAGAGYKLFNTGDVLTAAQVNTYLQEQVVMVFANATARTTALSGVLAEGMVSYLKDTDAVEKYNGSAWVSLAGSASPLTTKGDLYTYSTTDARLGVGNNGETLVADSSATTGLRWSSQFLAGKNKIINGDFAINQRAFTSVTADVTYGFDRWMLMKSGGTTTYTPQTFTPGTAPVAGYEGINFARVATTGQSASGDYSILSQRIEDVRTFANQTVTVSFWAKANTGTPKVAVELVQSFGSGGSPSADVNTYISNVTLSTSWARYTVTGTVPSISGKTIGTTANSSSLRLYLWTSAGSTFNSRTGSIGVQNADIDIWGVQAEAGSVATPFSTATGTLAGELAACQRYYFRSTPGSTYGSNTLLGYNDSTTVAVGYIVPPVPMRVKPTSIEFANQTVLPLSGSSQAVTAMAISNYAHSQLIELEATVASGLTAGAVTRIRNNNNTAGYIGLSAEL